MILQEFRHEGMSSLYLGIVVSQITTEHLSVF
nr:MAG TPA: hypothetical protein [Bacteriophage sp.]